jgi:hypothetical protein
MTIYRSDPNKARHIIVQCHISEAEPEARKNSPPACGHPHSLGIDELIQESIRQNKLWLVFMNCERCGKGFAVDTFYYHRTPEEKWGSKPPTVEQVRYVKELDRELVTASDHWDHATVAKEKLSELKDLLDDELISQKDYEKTRSQILDEFDVSDSQRSK